ncbi:MAG TPA: radical SAM protein, partial [bacterium]|nr:radical SAM protein [bacterium]
MNTLTKQSPITFIELPPTQFGILNGEANIDFYSAIRLPSRGIPALAGVLREENWENMEEINPLYHGRKGKLTENNFIRIYNSDILLISSITRTSPQSMKLADLYRGKNPDGVTIAGGPDATFRINEWLEHVDIVVKGEGEITLKELMPELLKEKPDLKSIDGIAFKENGKVILTEPRKLLSAEELSRLPHPYYDPTIRKKVASMVLEASRGCPNNCDFCSVTEMYGRAYRQKSKEYVIEELRRIEGIGEFCFFTDDNIAGNPAKTIELLKDIKKHSPKRKRIAQITIAAAFNRELLKAMKEAGFQYLCVGIESIVDKTLEFFGKPYRSNRIKEAIKIYRENGFWVHGMMMLGGDGDTRQTLRETGRWINKNVDSVQFFAPIPIPGTRFHDRMENEGRILTKDLYLYDGQHVVIRPKNFTPYEMQKVLYRMYRDFYSIRKSFFRNFGSKKVLMSMLFAAYATFL